MAPPHVVVRFCICQKIYRIPQQVSIEGFCLTYQALRVGAVLDEKRRTEASYAELGTQVEDSLQSISPRRRGQRLAPDQKAQLFLLSDFSCGMNDKISHIYLSSGCLD